MLKNIFLILISTSISIIVIVFAYEAFKSNEYDQWRLGYKNYNKMIGKITRASSNDVLIWEYIPNSEFVYANGVSIKINEHGFRQHNSINSEPEANSVRFAFIGDSVTLGVGVEYDKTFIRLFEDYANKLMSKTRIVSLNFGVDGYNAIQIEELLLTKVLSFKPHHVVYIMCLNDFDFDDASDNKIKYFKKPHGFFPKFMERALIHLFYSGKDYNEYHFDKNHEVVFNSILRMNDVLKENEISLHVAIVPAFQESIIGYLKGWKTSWIPNFDQYHLEHIHYTITSFLKLNRIPAVDLLDGFKKVTTDPRHYANDIWHPNRSGHDLITQSLIQSLLLNENAIFNGM